jgi:hypothetical protein
MAMNLGHGGVAVSQREATGVMQKNAKRELWLDDVIYQRQRISGAKPSSCRLWHREARTIRGSE